jgi:capsular exopolysaccharide synthesis family protein
MQDRINQTPESPQAISLREYGDILRRRRAIILQTFVIVLVAGVLITLFQTPTYRSTSSLLVEPQTVVINQASSDPLSELFQLNQQYSVMTQAQLLQSARIKNMVYKKVNFDLPRIKVEPIEGTSIIQVTVEGENAQRVSDTANKLLEVYKDDLKQRAGESLRNAKNFASGKQEAADLKVKAAQEELRRFKNKYSIPELQRSRDAQIAEVERLKAEYQHTQDSLVANQTRRSELLRLMGSDVATTRSDIPTPEADPTVQEYRRQASLLEVERKGMGEQPGASRDLLSVIDRRLSELLRLETEARRSFKVRTERVNPTRLKYEDELLDLTAQAASLTNVSAQQASKLATAEGRLKNFPEWENRILALQGIIESSGRERDYYATRANDLGLRLQTQKDNVSVVEEAIPPTDAVRPNRPQNILFSALLGIFLGVCFALLQELFDDRINSPEEAERVLRLPNLGYVPLIEEEGLRLIRDISTFSPLMESYRSLRTNINFAAVGTTMQSLVVTSSVPAEGKSTTVANLAMAMALDGKRVVIVDADLRRPSQHKLFRVDVSPGLTDILVGTHTIEETIRSTGVDNVHIIPSGSPPPNPAELLGSQEMLRFIARMEEQADIILFDTPPTLAVADAVVLAARTNGVILVIGFGETRKSMTKKAQEFLLRANANVLGTVLNRMESPNTGYYYGKYYVPATVDLPSAAGRAGNGAARPVTPPESSVAALDAGSDDQEKTR